MRLLRLGLLLLPLFAAPGRALAQERPLEEFVRQVGWLWSMGDVASLVDLFPAGGRVLLDTGRGAEVVNPRHAAAALRDLFEGREVVTVRTSRITLAGGTPPRGFGELSWSFRGRGAPAAQTRSVYVGAVWEGSAWRIGELRIMP